MSKRRKFTPEFKSQVVLQLLSGEKSMAELCREHQLTAQMVGQVQGCRQTGRQRLCRASHADNLKKRKLI